MNIELPKKFNIPSAEVIDQFLIMEQVMRYEDLMYELTYAQKTKCCIYCNKKLNKMNRTIDHRYPRITGGISITNNLFPCCAKCNEEKSDLLHEEYLVYRHISKSKQRNYIKSLKKQKENILKTIGYILPKHWVDYMNVNEIKYRKLEYNFRGKKYYRIMEFYNKYKKLPRPIIVDCENQLLDGYNIIVFAEDFCIQYIPVVKLENVVVIKY